jgi:hypothetical protein
MGFQIGAQYKKMNYDLTMCFKFVNSSNSYLAKRVHSNNSIELTNKFFGGYIGAYIGREIYYENSNELQLLTGIAIDGFDALNENKQNTDIKAESTWTYNFNFGIGIGFRHYTKNGIYIGIRAKYNIVGYSLNNVITFTGNPDTCTLVIGNLSNNLKSNNLKLLKYKYGRAFK